MRKVVLVTGGSSGIGKAICKTLASKGYTVYGTSRSANSGDTLENFKLLQLDVNSENSVAEAIQFVLDKEGQIDVLVNNAGLGIAGAIEESSIDDIKGVFETNVFGLIRVTQAVLPHLRKQRSGHIINISSLGGLMGLPYRGIYSSSKFAVEGISEALSAEVASFGIKVIVVEPGDFNTNINDNRLVTEANEESEYAETYQRLMKIIVDEVNNGKQPEVIGELIYKILNKKNPRLHYKVGTFFQKLAVFVKRLLSDTFDRQWERIIRNHYKL